MPPQVTAYLALGANIGPEDEKLASLRNAVEALCTSAALRVTARSSVYRSRPWGLADQPNFLNAVIEIETQLAPLDLLQLAKQTELALGRQKTVRWGPRLIDIDVLLYGNQTLVTPELVIPHVHLLERSFVVVPLLEISPFAQLPTGERISELADVCRMRQELDKTQTL